jgi:hypothetical protein
VKYEFTYGAPPPGVASRSYLFVVSHMRSFSSLLCHILGSHAEIAGYAEAHQAYADRADLLRLARKVEATIEGPLAGRYVLDKILHGDYAIAPAVLERPDVKVLLMVRNPDDTIPSILHMWRSLAKTMTAADAVSYYESRLDQIDACSRHLGGKALYLDAESLLDRTDTVLAGLSRWLGLSRGLSANYRTFKFSGERGFGDPSPHILAGKVIADVRERHRDYVPVQIPDALLQRAREHYRVRRAALLARHSTASPSSPAETG